MKSALLKIQSQKLRLKFSKQWVKKWEQEYGISLRKPYRKYSTEKKNLEERLQDYLKNVWLVK